MARPVKPVVAAKTAAAAAPKMIYPTVYRQPATSAQEGAAHGTNSRSPGPAELRYPAGTQQAAAKKTKPAGQGYQPSTIMTPYKGAKVTGSQLKPDDSPHDFTRLKGGFFDIDGED